jgi:eukaryotic-like serine/threonine-protein kinase
VPRATTDVLCRAQSKPCLERIHPLFRSADRNLLFGLLALQNNFIDRDALVDAFHRWVSDHSKPLDNVLVERGALSPSRHLLLAGLVEEHIKLHGGDPEKSLAALSSIGSVREALSRIADDELHASLTHVSAARRNDDDPFRTMPQPSLGESTSDGSRFRILRPHAQGGLGQVSVALDLELDRPVALKEIQARHADNLHSRSRFVQEAEITGKLEHPGIIPVYGLGHDAGGRPFYAMRFIQGDSLKEAIAAFHGDEILKSDAVARVSRLRELLRRFTDVCNAIAYAHSRGVLHRDLKPGNIMLGPYGETLVVDWGLAKPLGFAQANEQLPGDRSSLAEGPIRLSGSSGSRDETFAGTMVGTPAYASPEQITGRLDLVGPASDVYGLGATFYALLTGRAPVETQDVRKYLEKEAAKDSGQDLTARVDEHEVLVEMMRRVQSGEIPPPRSLDVSISKPLEAICRKATAVDPANRYHSARELADDVERWLADEPVSAWREPKLVRLGRWARRHRPWVASAAALALALIIGSLWVAKREMDNRRAREVEKAHLQMAEHIAQVTQYQATVGKVRADRSDPQPGMTWTGLDALADAARNTRVRDVLELRGEAAQCLATLDARPGAELNHRLNTGSIVFSPDSRWLAVAEFKAQGWVLGRVYLIDVATGEVRHRWSYDGGNVMKRIFQENSQEGFPDLDFSPDGRWLGLGLRSGRVFLWDVGEPARNPIRWSAHSANLTRLKFGPDGQTLWTASRRDHSVKCWRSNGESWSIDRPAGQLAGVGDVVDLAIGQSVVWISEGSTGKVADFDAVTFAPRGAISGLGSRIALAPGGRLLAGAGGNTLRIADAERREVIVTRTDNSVAQEKDPSYSALSFSPDGAWLASCVENDPPYVSIWEVSAGRLALTIPLASVERTSFAFSPDGQRLAVTGARKTLLYELRRPDVIRNMAHAPGQIRDVEWTSDNTLACAAQRGPWCEVSLWDLASGRRTAVAQVTRGSKQRQPAGLATHSNGALAVQTGGNSYLWAHGLSASPEQIPVEFVGDIGFSPDGTQLWGVSDSERVDAWSLADHRVSRSSKDNANVLSGRPGMNNLAVGNRWLVTAGADGYTKILDTRAAAGRRFAMWRQVSGSVESVALDRGETLVASGMSSGDLRLQAIPDGVEIASFPKAHRRAAEALAAAPDGRTLASGSVDGKVRLWNCGRDGRWRASTTLATSLGPVRRLRFSPDGRRLAVLVRNELAVRVWDLSTLERRLDELNLGVD